MLARRERLHDTAIPAPVAAHNDTFGGKGYTKGVLYETKK
jgi:hypothetical protein